MKFINLIFVIALAFIIQCVFYFGFESSYFNYKNLNEMPHFYKDNIYKYRFFSIEFFEFFDRIFQYIWEAISRNKSIQKSAQSVGTPFYFSLFLFNALFLIFSILTVNLILKMKYFLDLKESFKIAFSLFIIFLIGLSEFVITPYDLPSIFLILSGVYFSLKYFQSQHYKFLVFVSIVIAISTLFRESAALNLSFLAALTFQKFGFSSSAFSQYLKILGLPVFTFLCTYIGLRIYLDGSEVVQGNYLMHNILEFKNLLGILFFVICLKLGKYLGENRQLGNLFLIFCLPYFITLLFGGILWELRLFVPVLILFFFSVITPKMSSRNA